MKKRNLWLVALASATVVAVGCGGSGDEDGAGGMGGDASGSGGDASGTGGDATGTGGDMTGSGGDTTAMGGANNMAGAANNMAGAASTDGTCTGTADACSEQTQGGCVTAGCAVGGTCTGEAGCGDNDSALECNQDTKSCAWEFSCTGTVDDCSDKMSNVECGQVDGCTWNEN